MPLKSCVFSLVLKIINILSAARNSDGRSFHSMGPETEKDLSP